MSRPSSSSGSHTARKSPIEGWEVVGSSGSESQARVEGVEAFHCYLGLLLFVLAPAHVQADLVDPLALRTSVRGR